MDDAAPPLIGNLRKDGIGLRVFCTTYKCKPMVLLPLSRLTGWPDHYTVYDVRPRLRCTRCGETNPDIQPDWDNQPTVEYSHSNTGVTRSR